MPYPKAPAVLIVEDEQLIRMLAADAFTEAGFLVFEAEHAAAALLVLAGAANIHLLFTDVNMPGMMNGIDLAEQVTAATPELLIIITSALPTQRPIDHLSAAFMLKPYDIQGVCRTAKALLAA
jgi:CheY-like chemotaxis protein